MKDNYKAQPQTYRVVWDWHTKQGGDARQVCQRGLTLAEANALCNQLNMLAQEYQQDDKYTVEAE